MSWYHQTGDERGFADEGSPATMTIMPLQQAIPPQRHWCTIEGLARRR